MARMWMNGVWQDDEADLWFDRGISHGLGLFETILAVDGTPVFFDRHARRLSAACARLQWAPPREELWSEVCRALAESPQRQGRARVRIVVTSGRGRLDSSAPGDDYRIHIQIGPAAEAPTEISVMTASWVKDSRSPMAGLKCSAYAEHLLAVETAKRQGFEELLLFNENAQLSEAAMANVFLLARGGIVTPSLESGCLPGITREVVLELAEQLGISRSERVIERRDLEQCEGMFLTSAVRGPVRVKRWEQRELAGDDLIRLIRDAWLDQIMSRKAPDSPLHV